MSPLDDFNQNTAMAETGQRTDSRRRLSDKILNAFNHAYAVGEMEVAKKLKVALTANEKQDSAYDDMRHDHDPLGEADLWVSFVEARNSYRQVCEDKKQNTANTAAALEEMKEAYRVWSAS